MNRAVIAFVLLLPTLALAGPKDLHGTWQVQLTAEEQAQIDTLKKQAETDKSGDEMAKAMLKAMLAVTEMKVVIEEGKLTFSVLDEVVPTSFTSKEVEGGWALTTTNDEGVSKVITAKVNGKLLTLTEPEGKTQTFKRVQ